MFKSYFRRKKETSVLNTDSFEKRRFEQIFNMSKKLKEIGKNEEIPMFKELMGDIWASLYKMNPQIKSDDNIPEHLLPNKSLMQRLMNEEGYKDYHETTQLDDMLSAIGTIKFGEETKRWIELEKKRNEKLQKQLENIKELVKQHEKEQQNQSEQQIQNEEDEHKTQNQDNQGKNEGAEQQKSTDQMLNQAMEELSQQLSHSLNRNDTFAKAVSRAVSETKETKENLNYLFGGKKAGKESGELEKLPLRNKIELAEILSRDKNLLEIAKWAGKFTSIAQTKHKIKHKESTEQSGVETGDNIERLLPAELVQYKNPKTKKEFLRKLSEKETLQIEQKGKETLGRGSIILCLDQSGSMKKLENQSKGFTLALMSIAKRQKRNFVYIPFDDALGNVLEFPKGKIKPNELIHIARSFLNGGTNFRIPLNEVLRVINKDKYKDADIIFITDGEADLYYNFVEKFNEEKKKKSFNMLSLVIGKNGNTNEISKVSDRVIQITDFDDEGSYTAFEI